MTAPRKGFDSWRSGKGQTGIDGNKDANFSRRYAVDPWNKNPERNNIGNRGIPTTSARSKGDDDYSRGAVGIDGTKGEDILREVDIYEETSESSNAAFGTGTQRAGSAKDGSYDIFDEVQDQSSDDGTREIGSRGQKASVESDPWRPRTKGAA